MAVQVVATGVPIDARSAPRDLQTLQIMDEKPMNAETDQYYGRQEPSRTYKWGLVLPCEVAPYLNITHAWRVICWFKTKQAAQAYATRIHGQRPYAIARAAEWNL
jgi:hypothetical protein